MELRICWLSPTEWGGVKTPTSLKKGSPRSDGEAPLLGYLMLKFRPICPSAFVRYLQRFSSRFCVDFRHETPEEGRMTYRPKCCDYNNKDKVNSPNILSNNKNYITSHFYQQFDLVLCVLFNCISTFMG